MSDPIDSRPPPDDERVGSTPRAAQDHHAGLWSGLVERADAVTTAVTAEQDDNRAQQSLVHFLRQDVLAHLETEQKWLYEAARTAGANTLIDTLELDHRFLLDLVAQIERAATALEAALCARALVTLFALRMAKEDTVVLPTLRAAGVDVSSLLDRMVVEMTTDYGSRFGYV